MRRREFVLFLSLAVILLIPGVVLGGGDVDAEQSTHEVISATSHSGLTNGQLAYDDDSGSPAVVDVEACDSNEQYCTGGASISVQFNLSTSLGEEQSFHLTARFDVSLAADIQTPAYQLEYYNQTTTEWQTLYSDSIESTFDFNYTLTSSGHDSQGQVLVRLSASHESNRWMRTISISVWELGVFGITEPPQEPEDSDGDGVVDDSDDCPNTTSGAAVDAMGCSDSQRDSDADEVTDDVDSCDSTPEGQSVDANGCAESQKDDDDDGVTNDVDQCPASEIGATVNSTGCVEAGPGPQPDDNSTDDSSTNGSAQNATNQSEIGDEPSDQNSTESNNSGSENITEGGFSDLVSDRSIPYALQWAALIFVLGVVFLLTTRLRGRKKEQERERVRAIIDEHTDIPTRDRSDSDLRYHLGMSCMNYIEHKKWNDGEVKQIEKERAKHPDAKMMFRMVVPLSLPPSKPNGYVKGVVDEIRVALSKLSPAGKGGTTDYHTTGTWISEDEDIVTERSFLIESSIPMEGWQQHAQKIGLIITNTQRKLQQQSMAYSFEHLDLQISSQVPEDEVNDYPDSKLFGNPDPDIFRIPEALDGKPKEDRPKPVPGLHLVRTWDEFEQALRDENLHVPENKPGSAGKLADQAAHLRRLLKRTATQIVGIKAPSRSGKTSLIGSLLAEQQEESVGMFVTKGETIAKRPQTGYRYMIGIGHKVGDVEKLTFEKIRAGVKEVFEEHGIFSQRLQPGGVADIAGWPPESTTIVVATLLDGPTNIEKLQTALERRFEQDEVWVEEDEVRVIRQAPDIVEAVEHAVSDMDDDIKVLLVEDLGKKSCSEEVDALFSLIDQLNIPVIVTFADESISTAIEQKRSDSEIGESAIHILPMEWDRESAEAAIDSMLKEADEGVELETEAREYLVVNMSREEPELRMSVGIVGSQLNSALRGTITLSVVKGWKNSPLDRLVDTVLDLNGESPMALRYLLAIHRSLEGAVLPSKPIQDRLLFAGLNDIDDASTRYGLVPYQHPFGVEYSFYVQADDEWEYACNPERLSRLSGEGSKISGLDETMRILREVQEDLDKECNEFRDYLTELNRDTLESKKPCQDAAVWFEAVTAIEPPELLSIEVALDGVDDQWIRLAHATLRTKLSTEVPSEWWGEPQFKSYMQRRLQLSRHRNEKNPKDIIAVDEYAGDLWQLATQYDSVRVSSADEMGSVLASRKKLYEDAYNTWLSIEPTPENAKLFNDLSLTACMGQALLALEEGAWLSRGEIDRKIGYIEFMESWMSYLPYHVSIQWELASSLAGMAINELCLYSYEGVDDERVERLSSMIERNIESFQRIADNPDGFIGAEQYVERDDEGVAQQDIMRVEMHLASMKRSLLQLRLAVQGPAEVEEDLLDEIVEHLESLGPEFELYDGLRSGLASLHVWYNTLRMSEPTANQRQLWSEVAEWGSPSHSAPSRSGGITYELGLAYQLSRILAEQHPEMARYALLTVLELCLIVAPEARSEDVDSIITKIGDDHADLIEENILTLLVAPFNTQKGHASDGPMLVGMRFLQLLGVTGSEEE